jgi:beta-lactamase regulating signal transducer with metallopeptidase domain
VRSRGSYRARGRECCSRCARSPLSAACLFGRTFAAYEPATTTERVGILITALAVSAVWLALLVGRNTVRASLKTAAFTRLTRHCRAASGRFTAARLDQTAGRICVIESSYPVAALSGFFRPRVVLSDRVIRECEPDELEAILAHETAHVDRADNLARALMLSLPDVLAWLPSGRAIETAWSAAAEEAADDEAAGDAPEKRAALAAALVRVAGMAPAAPPEWMPALAFFRGEDLDRRVRRLLEPEPAAGRSVRALEPALVASAAAALVLCASQGPALHGAIEWAIRFLP